MSVIFADSEPPAMTQEQLDKVREYTDRIKSHAASMLSNASLLDRLLDQIQPTDPNQDAPA